MNKGLRTYAIYTYLLFILFIGIIGLVKLLYPSNALFVVLKTISAWTPTFVLLLMFKKFYPQDNRLDYIRRQFSEKVKPATLAAAIGLLLAIFAVTLLVAVLIYQRPFHELIVTSFWPLLYMLPLQLASGPLGEELGWRAFLLTELQKKCTLLQSGLIVGLVWGFWHLPLWLVSGYGGLELALYVASFLVSIVCCSLIMTILYSKCRNLLIPILIHLLNNYLLGLFQFNLVHGLALFAAAYLAATVILIWLSGVWGKRSPFTAIETP